MSARTGTILVLFLALVAFAGCNSAPVANDDVMLTPSGRPIEGDVISNDLDPDGDKLAIEKVTQPMNGRVSIRNDRTIVYAPLPGFTGEDEFTYVVTDGEDEFARGRVAVSVAPPSKEAAPLPAGQPRREEKEKKEEARKADWRTDTVGLDPSANTLVVEGPFHLKLLAISSQAPVEFKLGPIGGITMPAAGEVVGLPMGSIDFFVPEGKALYATGDGSLTFSGYRSAGGATGEQQGRQQGEQQIEQEE